MIQLKQLSDGNQNGGLSWFSRFVVVARSGFLITFAWSAALHADIDVDDITAVWILSTGLSLPNETGRGLSEHGDASRETLSESSSLNTVPENVEKKGID